MISKDIYVYFLLKKSEKTLIHYNYRQYYLYHHLCVFLFARNTDNTKINIVHPNDNKNL